ncbi:MAG TPA: HU family DNA-binding protein [Polyangiaceae bacterium]|nr:HU family DNA-binding protein [Polyangiaceae bacterium]
MTKAQVIAELANASDLDKKSVGRVFEGLQELIRKQLSARGPGEFVVPGLVKLRVVKKPATKERQGINPFTKEPITIPAKPASKKVRARLSRTSKTWFSELFTAFRRGFAHLIAPFTRQTTVPGFARSPGTSRL